MDTKIKVTAFVIFVFWLIVVGIYGFNFFGPLGDQTQFGEFGDYLGGVLNPLLGTATIILLIWSINVQLRELNTATKQIKLSAEASAAQKDQLRLESKLRLLSEQLERKMIRFQDQIDNAVGTKIIEHIKQPSGQVSRNSISIELKLIWLGVIPDGSPVYKKWEDAVNQANNWEEENRTLKFNGSTLAALSNIATTVSDIANIANLIFPLLRNLAGEDAFSSESSAKDMFGFSDVLINEPRRVALFALKNIPMNEYQRVAMKQLVNLTTAVETDS